MGDPGRDDDPFVRAELTGLDDGARAGSRRERTDVDQRDEGATGEDDPVVELAAVVMEAAQDAGRGRGQVRLDEARRDPARRAGLGGRQGSEGTRPPQLAERAALVRVACEFPEPDAGQRVAHRAAAARCRRSDGR